MVANTVINGINPKPNQTTGGEGPTTGQEVLISFNFLTPVELPADHYFFRPEAQLSSGNFLWLSAAGPPNFAGDLQHRAGRRGRAGAARRHRRAPAPPRRAEIVAIELLLRCFNVAFIIVGDL